MEDIFKSDSLCLAELFENEQIVVQRQNIELVRDELIDSVLAVKDFESLNVGERIAVATLLNTRINDRNNIEEKNRRTKEKESKRQQNLFESSWHKTLYFYGLLSFIMFLRSLVRVRYGFWGSLIKSIYSAITTFEGGKSTENSLGLWIMQKSVWWIVQNCMFVVVIVLFLVCIVLAFYVQANFKTICVFVGAVLLAFSSSELLWSVFIWFIPIFLQLTILYFMEKTFFILALSYVKMDKDTGIAKKQGSILSIILNSEVILLFFLYLAFIFAKQSFSVFRTEEIILLLTGDLRGA